MSHRPSIIRQDTSSYQPTPLGLNEKTVDFRTETHCEHERITKPDVRPGTLYVDHDFPMEKACGYVRGLEWKRPKDIVDNPKLFTEGTTRFDIGQGEVGSCWFLSVLADVAANKIMINQLIPEDAYSIEDPNRYDGVFHARFFLFGKWEDVYVDDFLPVKWGSLWGAHSSSDPQEMWVALLEKAFARLHGNYEAISGGQARDSYQMLTGGCGEALENKDFWKNPGDLHKRVSNAIRSGAQVTCSVQAVNENCGLRSYHAYSLVDTTQVGSSKLYRIRNPWGKTEWNGPWSDGTPEWHSIPNKDLPNADDGEFYMSQEDFISFFSTTTICSITPDIDCDGDGDNLKYIINGFGNWREGCDGGFYNCLNNPRYTFEVPKVGLAGDSTVPCVTEIIQHTNDRKTDIVAMRMDIFKIIGDRRDFDGRSTLILEKTGPKEDVIMFTQSTTAFYRHRLEPGHYVLIPYTQSGGKEKEFLVRTFSPAPSETLTEVSQEANLMVCETEEKVSVYGNPAVLRFEKTMFGDFISGRNAGGQIRYSKTFDTNPQYAIEIPYSGEPALLSIHFLQMQPEPQYPMGIRLFNLEEGVSPPVDYNYLSRYYQSSPRNTNGAQYKFIAGTWDANTQYVLQPGRYLAVFHFDRPNTEKEFCIVFKCTTDVDITGYQTK